MYEVGKITVKVMQIIPNNDVFNYFFTIVSVFGLIAFSIGILVKLISRS